MNSSEFINARCTGKGEYELIGIQMYRGRKCAKIHSKESLSISKKKPGAEEKDESKADTGMFGKMMENLSFDLSNSGSGGIAYWDYENGELVSHKATDSMTIKIGLAPDPDKSPSPRARGSRPSRARLRI